MLTWACCSGFVNQIVLALTMVGLITVIVRGYRMWWQRRPTRGSVWAVGRAPLRGALSQLPPWGSVAVIVVAAVIGWALPLFGLSLVAFLLVDVALAWWKGRIRPPGAG